MSLHDPSRPKSLRHPDAQAHRRLLLGEPHVVALTALAERLRRETGRGRQVPFFDPLDAGTSVECVFILQAPGTGAVESGFVSRDNDDETARHFFELTRDAGLDRRRTITWNAVPWHQEGSTITARDLDTGLRYLQDVFDLLPQCRAMVLLGGKAQKLAPQLALMRPGWKCFEAPLPSPLFINRSPENRERIAVVFRKIVAFLGPSRDDSRTTAPAADDPPLDELPGSSGSATLLDRTFNLL
jgi:uracil-DNA glycosylase